MSDDDSTVEVSARTLEILRDFAIGCCREYGWEKELRAIVDAGEALGVDDPRPEWADDYLAECAAAKEQFSEDSDE